MTNTPMKRGRPSSGKVYWKFWLHPDMVPKVKDFIAGRETTQTNMMQVVPNSYRPILPDGTYGPTQEFPVSPVTYQPSIPLTKREKVDVKMFKTNNEELVRVQSYLEEDNAKLKKEIVELKAFQTKLLDDVVGAEMERDDWHQKYDDVLLGGEGELLNYWRTDCLRLRAKAKHTEGFQADPT